MARNSLELHDLNATLNSSTSGDTEFIFVRHLGLIVNNMQGLYKGKSQVYQFTSIVQGLKCVLNHRTNRLHARESGASKNG